MAIAAPIVLALGLGALVGWVDMIVEPVQVPAGLLLLSSLCMGVAQPRRAWLHALLIGSCVPLAHVIGWAIGYRLPYPSPAPPASVLMTLPMALVAAYVGAGLRWMFTGGGRL
jgi:hypothetical protein